MTIWDYQKMLTRRLLGWSILSIVAGFPLWLDSYLPIKNIGTQFIAWGAIDGLIALFGWRSAEKRQATADPIEETRKLRRILWLNTFLDIGYMAGGGWLLAKEDKGKQGTGLGVLIQGAFLFFFDLWHVLRLKNLSDQSDS